MSKDVLGVRVEIAKAGLGTAGNCPVCHEWLLCDQEVLVVTDASNQSRVTMHTGCLQKMLNRGSEVADATYRRYKASVERKVGRDSGHMSPDGP